jgi:hypothetical protein
MQSSFPSFYYYILRQEIYIHLGLYSIHSEIDIGSQTKKIALKTDLDKLIFVIGESS